MNIGKFITFTALGAGLWNCVLAVLGWYLESIVPEDQLISTVTKYSDAIGHTIIILVIIALGYIIYKGFKKK
jgi:membrane protein DedA with SNARE-associated domain